MKTSVPSILSALALAICAVPLHAQETAAPASAHVFSGNIALTSDYRFRGLSQTFEGPSLQGGFDYAHASGLYLGNWNANVSGVQYPGGAGLEMDVYGGYKFAPVTGMNADIGLLKYHYPGARIGVIRPDALELYVGASYKWFSAKYSHAIADDYFGFADARGSYYLDLGANVEIADKTVLGLHVGRQTFKNAGGYDYTDYKVSVSRDLGWATVGLALVGTDGDGALYTVANAGGKTKDIGDTGAVLSISKTF